MKKIQSNSKKDLDKAKVQSQIKFNVGGKDYLFEADIFSLTHDNIGILSEEISKIPSYFAYIGNVLAEAEKELREEQLVLELFEVRIIANYPDLKSESAKRNIAIKDYQDQYRKYSKNVSDCEYKVRILKTYRDGIEAKYNLAQTLCANIRAEQKKYEGNL